MLTGPSSSRSLPRCSPVMSGISPSPSLCAFRIAAAILRAFSGERTKMIVRPVDSTASFSIAFESSDVTSSSRFEAL